MSRHTIGDAVAARLFAAEAAIDDALIETARLAALLPSARSQARLAATTGQAAFNGAAASLSALTDARARLVETHRSLAAVARMADLPLTAVGPLDKAEDRPPVGDEENGVRSDFTIPDGNRFT